MKADAKTEAEVMSVLNKFRDCYANRDLNGLIALFASDDDMITIGTGEDEKCIGPERLKVQLERDFNQSESMSVTFDWLSISAAGTVAWIAADCVFDVRVSGEQICISGRLTAVLEKRGDNWLIVQEHVSIPFSEQEEGQSFPA